jgi:predicted DNA-binding transcriptional regulator AlpA
MATNSIDLIDSKAALTSQEPSSKQLLLDGYLRREELAQQLGVSARTIDRWQMLRCGPPRVAIGRTILFNLDSVRQWLQSREQASFPAKPRRNCRRQFNSS